MLLACLAFFIRVWYKTYTSTPATYTSTAATCFCLQLRIQRGVKGSIEPPARPVFKYSMKMVYFETKLFHGIYKKKMR